MKRLTVLVFLLLGFAGSARAQAVLTLVPEPGGNGTSFGNVAFNSTDHPFSYPLFFILTNSGNAGATSVASAFSGTNSADLTIYSSPPSAPVWQYNPPAPSAGPFQYPACGATLAAGAACYVAVKLTPSVASAESATLTVTANVSVSGGVQNLTGTGETATAVSSCGTLSTGDNYLTANVSATGTCFTISSGTVTLNLNGHSITYGTTTTSGSNVYGVKVTQKNPHLIYNGSVIQGNCLNPSNSTAGSIGGSGDIVVFGGAFHQSTSGGTLGGIHDTSLSHCSDSSAAIAVDFTGSGGGGGNFYNNTLTPNVVTSGRRADFMGYSMSNDATGGDTYPANIHDIFCSGTETQGCIAWGVGGNQYQGTATVTNGSNTVTWVSGFSTNGGGDTKFSVNWASATMIIPLGGPTYTITSVAGGGGSVQISPAYSGSSGTVTADVFQNTFYNNYSAIGNPNGTATGNGFNAGTVSVTNGSPTVTWVSGFTGSGLQLNYAGQPQWTIGGVTVTVSSVAANGLTATLSANYSGTTNASAAASVNSGQYCLYGAWTNAAGTLPANAGGACTNGFAYWYTGAANNLIVNNTEGRGLPLSQDVQGISVANSTVISSLGLANNQEYNGCEIGGGYGLQFKKVIGDVYTASGNTITSIANQCYGQALRVLQSKSYSNVSSNNIYIAKRAGGAPNNCDGANNSNPKDCAVGVSFDGPQANGDQSDLLWTSQNDSFTFDSIGLFYDFDGLVRRAIFRSPTFTKGSNPSTYFKFIDTERANNTTDGVATAIIDPTYNSVIFPCSDASAPCDIPQSGGSRPAVSVYQAWTQTYTVLNSINSVPIVGATVTLTDSKGDRYNCVTNSSGQCAPVDVTDFGFPGQGIPPVDKRDNNDTAANQVDTGYNPYSVSISAPGFVPLSQSGVTFSATQSITKQLAAINTGTPAPAIFTRFSKVEPKKTEEAVK